MGRSTVALVALFVLAGVSSAKLQAHTQDADGAAGHSIAETPHAHRRLLVVAPAAPKHKASEEPSAHRRLGAALGRDNQKLLDGLAAALGGDNQKLLGGLLQRKAPRVADNTAFGATLQGKHGHSPHGHSPFADSRRRRTHYERRRRCSTGEYKDEGADDCKDCTPGHFQPVVGTHDQTSCSACAAGKFQPSTKASVCPDCPAHHYNLATAQTGCMQCLDVCPITGEHAPSCGGATKGACEHVLAFGSNPQCMSCSAGRFIQSAGSQTCTSCDDHHCPAGHQRTGCGLHSVGTCDQCAVGYHKTGSGSHKCVECAVHTYADSPSSTGCTGCSYHCPDGQEHTACGNAVTYVGITATLTSEAGTCKDCASGRWLASKPAGTLLWGENPQCKACNYHCDAGLEKTGCSGGSPGKCTACPPGFVKGVAGTDMCVKCAAGRFSASTVACADCASGRFQAAEGQPSCDDCDYHCGSGQEHHHCGGESAGDCAHCNPGYFKQQPGDAACSSCAEHYFTADHGSSHCKPCQYRCPPGQQHSACGQAQAGLGNFFCQSAATGYACLGN